MSQAITIDTKTARTILETLEELKKEVTNLREKLESSEPPYGSNEWWKWSDKKAKDDIKKGRVVRFDTVQEAIGWLNS